MKTSPLKALRQQIEDHPTNAWAKKKGFLPVYTASETAKIVIVGQAPGRVAQQTQMPWNDVSGDTLRKWLNISRETFYDVSQIALIPMDFYYPGKGKHGDLPPRKEFASLWHPQLLAHMPYVELILLIGQYAQKYYLDKNRKHNLTETVLTYQEYLPKFFPLVHPSPLNIRWRKKNAWFETEVVPVLEGRVKKILKK